VKTPAKKQSVRKKFGAERKEWWLSGLVPGGGGVPSNKDGNCRGGSRAGPVVAGGWGVRNFGGKKEARKKKVIRGLKRRKPTNVRIKGGFGKTGVQSE